MNGQAVQPQGVSGANSKNQGCSVMFPQGPLTDQVALGQSMSGTKVDKAPPGRLSEEREAK